MPFWDRAPCTIGLPWEHLCGTVSFSFGLIVKGLFIDVRSIEQVKGVLLGPKIPIDLTFLLIL